jgi:hypothetical protein
MIHGSPDILLHGGDFLLHQIRFKLGLKCRIDRAKNQQKYGHGNHKLDEGNALI